MKKFATAIGNVADVILYVKTALEQQTSSLYQYEEVWLHRSADRVPLNFLQQRQQQTVNNFFVNETNLYLTTLLASGKNFTALSKENVIKMQNTTNTAAEKYESMVEQQESKYNVTLTQLKQSEIISKENLKQFEKSSEKQIYDYDISLRKTIFISNLSNTEVRKFLKLAEQQSNQYQLTRDQLQEFRYLWYEQKYNFKKLNQFTDMSKIQVTKLKDVSREITSLTKEQTHQFEVLGTNEVQRFHDVIFQVSDFKVHKIKEAFKGSDTQLKMYTESEHEFQQIADISKLGPEQLYTLTQLVSEGFKDLQEHMDSRFERIEKMITVVQETTLFISYENDVKSRLRKLYNSYLFFLASTINLTDSHSATTETALQYLLKHCCKNPPNEIMATIYHKTVSNSMHSSTLFQTIYDAYFEHNTERMLTLFQKIMADVFQTAQMLAICDEITNGGGIGFDEACNTQSYCICIIVKQIYILCFFVSDTQSREILRTLDQIITGMVQHALNLLVDQNYVMGGIIKKYRSSEKAILTKENKEIIIYPDDLGCHVNQTDFDFAIDAARELERKFYFFTFFVVVYRYNEAKVKLTNKYTNVKKPYSFRGNSSINHFTFKVDHSESKNKHEKILILTTFIQKNFTVNPGCLLNIKLHCSEWKSIRKARVHNTLIFHAQQHGYVCGTSSAGMPNNMKICLTPERPLYVAVCY